MDALDLHVEERLRIDDDAAILSDDLGEPELVVAADGGEPLVHPAIVGMGAELTDQTDIVRNRLAAEILEEAGQARVGIEEPAPWRDAVCDVRDPLREGSVQLGENRLLHQVRVQGRDAVDGVGADEGEVCHAHAPAVMLVDQRQARQISVG